MTTTESIPAGDGTPHIDKVDEAIYDFNKLNEPSEISHTLDLFNEEQLLARAMDGPIVGDPAYNRQNFEFSVWDKEIALMARPGGMPHVSTTLMIPRYETPLYKGIGLLVDSGLTAIEHVAASDSGSRSSGTEGLVANPSDLETLDDLKVFVHEHQDRNMNEVNATIPLSGVRGLFTNENPETELEALVVQRHFERKGLGCLPIFTYSRREGLLKHWQPTNEEVAQLLRVHDSAPELREYYEALL